MCSTCARDSLAAAPTPSRFPQMPSACLLGYASAGTNGYLHLHLRGSRRSIGKMTYYGPTQIAELLGVSSDSVRRWCDDGRLKAERDKGGQRRVKGAELARFLADHPAAYEPKAVFSQSARNRFTGIVTRVERDKVTALVEIYARPYRIVSLMTREAADELELEPGKLATAAVKSTNVVVEVVPG